MNNYLIPANANRGRLILGYFRPIDLIIFVIGLAATFILFLIFQDYADNTVITITLLAPVLIALFLVLPIPYQHNVLVLLTAIYNFYFVNRQRYIWRGWCTKYVENTNKK